MELFGRQVAIEYGVEGTTGKRFDTLRVGFNIEHKLSSTPNKGKITVWNADNDTVSLLQRPNAVVRLFAGYAGNAGLIFQGNPIATQSTKHPVKQNTRDADWSLVIEAMDGVRVYNTARVSVSYGAAVAWQTVLNDVLSSTGLSLGAPPPAAAAAVAWPSGVVLEGTARAVLTRLAAKIGAHWHIRDGVLILTDGGVTGELAPLLSTARGNLLSFEPTETGWAIRTLLDPAMRSGRRVKVEGASKSADGIYVIRDLTFVGDSGYDTPFYCDMTAQSEASATAVATVRMAPGGESSGGGTNHGR